ncbi:MAG: AmmeMemoRadiSam system protein B [Halioglobus sp.]|nr:AmmeMemoRadiSam system protein B [Halioglobus sp.]
MKVRRPAVAGMFYEDDAARLRAHLDALLEDAPAPAGGDARPRALIVPHAGYIYSGETAARAYRLLLPWAREIRRVALFGPAHRVPLHGLAVPSVTSFATPLGEVPLDRELLERAAALPGVCVSDEAHRVEHSLEVQLPFLQAVLGDFTLAPLVVGEAPPEQVAAVIDALWTDPQTLLVVSTDLSHFLSYEEASRRDSRTCQRVLDRDSGLSGLDACGARALNGLLSSRGAQALDIELLDRCNSGDSIGDKQRVVGYGAFALR